MVMDLPWTVDPTSGLEETCYCIPHASRAALDWLNPSSSHMIFSLLRMPYISLGKNTTHSTSPGLGMTSFKTSLTTWSLGMDTALLALYLHCIEAYISYNTTLGYYFNIYVCHFPILSLLPVICHWRRMPMLCHCIPWTQHNVWLLVGVQKYLLL